MTPVSDSQMSDENRKTADHSAGGIIKYADRPIGGDCNRRQRGRRLTIVHKYFRARNQNVTSRKFVAFFVNQPAHGDTVTLNRLVEDAIDHIDQSIGGIDSDLIKTTEQGIDRTKFGRRLLT